MFSHSLLMFKEVEVEVVEVSGSQQVTFVAMALYLLEVRLVTPIIPLPAEAAQEDGLQFTWLSKTSIEVVFMLWEECHQGYNTVDLGLCTWRK